MLCLYTQMCNMLKLEAVRFPFKLSTILISFLFIIYTHCRYTVFCFIIYFVVLGVLL